VHTQLRSHDASVCKSECAKAAKEAEKAANPKVPKELAQLQKLQKEMVAALECERDMLLKPLLERKQTVQDELSEIILEHGVGSAEFTDASMRLSARRMDT
jgi:phage shock protein A